MSETYNPFSLKGKNILVTGASSGIGRAIAIECSKMGANLIITGRDEGRLNETMQKLTMRCHIGYIGDLTSEDDVERIAESCEQLDGVVHCAGIGDRTILSAIKRKTLDKVMNINFNAPVLLQKALLKKKKIADKASIVFVASRAPFAPTVGNGLYAASKGALIAYSKVLGLELSERLIRVNCICPAMVWTELVERDQEITGVNYHEKELLYPLKRYGQPKDVAYLAIYMLSDASSWMTGSCVDLTGGANSL